MTSSKPKGRTSAYAYFVKTFREELRAKHPNGLVRFAEFSRQCSHRWQGMSDEDREPYRVMATVDAARYRKQMSQYKSSGLWAVDRRRVRARSGKRNRSKWGKCGDPNAPKRPLTAYFWFCAHERPVVREAMPGASVTEVAKELGRRWARCEPETRDKFVACAARDKVRYEKEMKAYKGAQGVGVD